MRSLNLAILFIFAQSAAWATLSTVRVWPQFRDASSFERIGEFLNGQEVTEGDVILRTEPLDRTGFYLLVRLKNHDADLTNVRAELSIILPESPKPLKYNSFPTFSVPDGTHVLQVGVTGRDWPSALAHPVAWQLRLLDSEGREVLREASFLWGPP